MKHQDRWTLATGQVWRTRIARVEILKLGRRLIHYRITKHLGEKWASAQVSPITALQNYLSSNEANLVAGDAVSVGA